MPEFPRSPFKKVSNVISPKVYGDSLDIPTGRCATLTVAANNSSAHSKQQADYVCDGTADDVEIQAAIDDLPANGGKVTCLEGTFSTQNTVNGIDNLIFGGMGYATRIIASTLHTGYLVNINAKSNVLVGDMYLDGDVYADMGVSIENGATDITVQRCYGFGGKDDTFAAKDAGTKRIKFIDNIIDKTTSIAGGSACIELSDDVYDVLIEGNTLTGSHATYSIDGIKANYHAHPTGPNKRIIIKNNTLYNLDGTGIAVSINNSIIKDNTIYNCGQDANKYGIHLSEDNHILSSNYIYNPSSYGIYIAGSNVSVSKCTIDSAGDHGINTAGSGTDSISVINNIVTNCQKAGINLNNCSNSKVSINTCANNGQSGAWNGNGIHIGGSSNGVSILNNNCYDDQGTKTQFYGIGISDTLSNLIIKNNILLGNKIGAFRNWGVVSGSFIMYDKYTDLLMDVLTSSTTHIRSNEDLSAATPITFTLDAQPDIPRTLSWSFDTHAQITEYDMEVIGVDAKGNTITETWDETAGWSGETSNAFATISSIKMTSRTGTGTADTMDIGITDVLGLSNVIYETSDVFKIKKNNANATVATAQVNTTYDTYDMSVIGLGAADDFTVWHKSNLNIIS